MITIIKYSLLFVRQTLGQQLLPEVPHAHLLSPRPASQSQRPEAGPEEDTAKGRGVMMDEFNLHFTHESFQDLINISTNC